MVACVVNFFTGEGAENQPRSPLRAGALGLPEGSTLSNSLAPYRPAASPSASCRIQAHQGGRSLCLFLTVSSVSHPVPDKYIKMLRIQVNKAHSGTPLPPELSILLNNVCLIPGSHSKWSCNWTQSQQC